MLSDTDSMNIFNAHSLIECTTHDEDKNAINLKFIIVSCKNVGGLFPTHIKDTIILLSFFLEGRSLPSKFQLKPVRSFILLVIYSVICSVFKQLLEVGADMNTADDNNR